MKKILTVIMCLFIIAVACLPAFAVDEATTVPDERFPYNTAVEDGFPEDGEIAVTGEFETDEEVEDCDYVIQKYDADITIDEDYICHVIETVDVRFDVKKNSIARTYSTKTDYNLGNGSYAQAIWNFTLESVKMSSANVPLTEVEVKINGDKEKDAFVSYTVSAPDGKDFDSVVRFVYTYTIQAATVTQSDDICLYLNLLNTDWGTASIEEVICNVTTPREIKESYISAEEFSSDAIGTSFTVEYDMKDTGLYSPDVLQCKIVIPYAGANWVLAAVITALFLVVFVFVFIGVSKNLDNKHPNPKNKKKSKKRH